jgi:F-type H+-transporting ATPase subunit alpha
MSVEEQVIVIFAGTTGLIDDVAVADVQRFQKDLVEFVHSRYSGLLTQIATKKQITDETRAQLKQAVGEFKEQFQPGVAAARA